jgi:uncharacterized protein YbjT (DUF2867 family)
MMNNGHFVFVTGATGNVGRQVVLQLLREGVHVRALVRNPQSAHLPKEVEVVRGDLSLPETLEGAQKGAVAVFLLWRLPSADAAPTVVEHLAKHAPRIVFLSSSAIRDDVREQTGVVAKVHAGIERFIENSAREWTFLRPGGFATNALW